METTALPVLNTFISESLQIDQDPAGLTPSQANQSAKDANLFDAADPADGTPSFSRPGGGPAAFIDWQNLAADAARVGNHRLLDPNVPGGKDPSSFPHSNECVGNAMVLSKMDLTYIAAANNNAWAYFAVQRSNNNGDAGYYWLFTRQEPQLLTQAPCGAGEKRLMYQITAGDVLLRGHFHPSADDPLLTVYRAQSGTAGFITAVEAINYQSSLWAPVPGAVGAVAVNTTITRAGAMGSSGVVAVTGQDLGAEIVAESAVPVHVFTGGNNCGAVFYGSVITRSSGSGGTSPDLKDLAGPAVFNFGRPTARPKLTPFCDGRVQFEITSAAAPDGTPIPISDLTCTWSFNNGAATASGCSGSTAVLGPGSHSATVSVTAGSTACAADVPPASVRILPPPAVQADLQGNCAGSFTFAASGSGGAGAGNFSYLWSFTGGGATSISGSPSPSGEVTVSTGNADYSGTVVLTEARPDTVEGQCTATATDTTRVLMPLEIQLVIDANAPVCADSDAATYRAIPAGGTGNYNLSWNGASCTGALCTINPADNAFCYSQSFNVHLADADAARLHGIQCADRDSGPARYEKVTRVTATAPN